MAHLLRLPSLSLSLSRFLIISIPYLMLEVAVKGALALEYGIVEQFGKEETVFQGRKCVMGVREFT